VVTIPLGGAAAIRTPVILQGGEGGFFGTGQFTSGSVAYAVLVLVAAYLLAKTVSYLLSVAADRVTQHRFRVTTLIPIAKLAIYGGAVSVVAGPLFRLRAAQLVAFAGLLGAALGLGLKDFLADIVGGLVVVFEKPYQVGDKVTLGEHYGEIIDIGLRSTRLVTPNDTVVVVPNFFFFNDSIANANAGNAEMLVTVEFYVAPDADADRAARAVEDALVTSPYVYVDDDHPYDVVLEDDLYYRTVRGRAYVNDLRNELPFRTDVSRRVLAEYDRIGIDSPKMAPGVDAGGVGG